MRPDLPVVEALLARVRRRLDLRAAAQGAALGVSVAAVAALIGWPTRPAFAVAAGAAFVVAGMLLRVLATRASRGSVSAFVERRVPTSRNVILTAHELSNDERARSPVGAMVIRRAAEVASGVDVRMLVPMQTAAIAFAAAFGVWLFVVARAGFVVSLGRDVLGVGASSPTIDGVEIVVTPPSYARQAARTLRDPSRIEALAGSRINVKARTRASAVLLQTLASTDTIAARNGEVSASLVAAADGFIALEPRGTGGAARRLIGLSVLPDSAPRVAITRPGHDERLANGKHTIDVGIEAGDDIGLASLRLHFTKVSGSGERFTFSEGDVPIAITRTDARRWTARAAWKLDPLELGPGDMVVYRAIATDGRPGSPPIESDSYIAEVASVGGEAAAGFAVDPEQDRYAVSQQMVILKTERLLARRATMAAEDYRTEAQQLAAEQRKVRAEFVFMLGGELADAPDVAASLTELNEEAEAEGEADILAGRNANAGHIALLRAIRSMSRAATLLTTADLDPALPHERSALAQLESAFSHTRILLRALSTRERLDLSRRLTGVLTDAVREQRASPAPTVDSRTAALRRALSDVASVAGGSAVGDSSAARLSLLAEHVLRVDASSKPLQEVARHIDDASRTAARGESEQTRRALDQAANGLVAVLRGGFVDAPSQRRSVDVSQLAGALRDAQRRDVQRGGSRP